ncbi:MAG: hypothetical protein ACRECW_01210 [Phyllobacterium sp.]
MRLTIGVWTLHSISIEASTWHGHEAAQISEEADDKMKLGIAGSSEQRQNVLAR